MPTSVKLRAMHIPDEKLGFRLVPNYEMRHVTSDFDKFIKINSLGFRDHEHTKRKDPSTFRILALGDSFTLGLGVNLEESYSKILETRLNNNNDGSVYKNYEVINAGVDGYGTEQEYLYYSELGKEYAPDLVILGLHTNDIDEVAAGIQSTYSRTKLKNSVYFLSYLRSLQIITANSLVKSRGDLLQLYQGQYTLQFENAIKKTKDYIEKIRDISTSNGAKTMMVIIPFCLEIDRKEWDKKGLSDIYSEDFFNKNMTRFSDVFVEFGQSKNISTLPLLPAFRNSKTTPLYYSHDPHWTPEGHKLAAESIYRFIKESGLDKRSQ